MKAYLDCFPCFLRQTLEAARMSAASEAVQRRILDEVMKELVRLPYDVTPPQVGQIIHRLIRKITGNKDPYHSVKQQYNEMALEMYPALRKRVRSSKDPVLAAVKLAIAGNIVDFGALSGNFDLAQVVGQTLSSDLALDDYESFRTSVERAAHIVYLGDNAGEIVFDRILIETLLSVRRAQFVFVVRGVPVINDATAEDARCVGLDQVVEVIPDGSDAPATVLSECSPAVQELFGAADMVIAKGQGNYEWLSNERGPLFFLLKAKCPVVAEDLGVEVGDLVLRQSEVVLEHIEAKVS
jgi:uncharacterized protein with ATP-grasp and redox domains